MCLSALPKVVHNFQSLNFNQVLRHAHVLELF